MFSQWTLDYAHSYRSLSLLLGNEYCVSNVAQMLPKEGLGYGTAMAHAISDRTIKALLNGKAPDDVEPDQYGRIELIDANTPGFGIRLGKRGLTFLAFARFGDSPHPVRRVIGKYGNRTNREAGVFTLADARAEFERWRENGIDPKEERQRAIEEHRLAQEAKECARANTFARVAQDFIREKLPAERKGAEVERDIRRNLLPKWGGRPIADITARDIRELVKGKRETPAQARNLLGTIKRLFAWAVDEDAYSLNASPADALKPAKIVGEKVSRERILSDEELFALWRAAGCLPYPCGPVYQVLILSALRLNEAADAARSEFDFREQIWTIPASRMKGKNSRARPHTVPLTDGLMAILQNLPEFKKGDFLFSTTFGVKPVWLSNKIKKRVDRRMLRTLRALARRRGDDPAKVKLPKWVNHDIRRTVRSQLSRLKVTEEAREAVMAHVRPGIKGTYDRYKYLDEKREALELWAARLREIVTPPPDNVIRLKGKLA